MKAAVLVSISSQYFEGRFELALSATLTSYQAVIAMGITPSPRE